MTFKHKLAHRLALLRDRWIAVAVVALAIIGFASCELPRPIAPPAEQVAQLVISPKAIAAQPDQDVTFMSVGLTPQGDTASITVTWGATAGSVADGGSTGGRHYGRYRNATCGAYKVWATSDPGAKSDTANVTVTCAAPVASVEVTPASASVDEGKTVQLTATPKDANGTPLPGRVVTWSSNNATVATVSASGLVTGKVAGSATITATSEGQSASSAITVTPVPVASVDVTPPSASVDEGKTVQLTATPKDANGTPLSGRAITWGSSNTSVATVSTSGLVTGVTAGSASITATTGGKSGTSAITVVTPPPPGTCQTSSTAWLNTALSAHTGSLTVQFDATPHGTGLDAQTGLSAGAAAASTDLAVIVRFGPGGTIDARNGAAYAAANSIPYVAGTSYRFRLVIDVPTHRYSAYVTPSGGTEAIIGTGYAFRTEQNTVTALGNWALRAAAGSHTVCNFAVLSSTPPAPVASVDVTPAATSVEAGKTVQLSATPKDANGNPLPGRAITWSSSSTTVATVSASGLVTGNVAGSATITATSEGQSGASAVTVTAPPAPVPVASVDVTPASASVDEGKTVQLTATPKDANGTPLPGRVVTWVSGNTSVATVSASGLVTGKVAGSATITATSEGQSGTSAITVVRVPVASVTVAPATATVQVGSTVQLSATPKDATGSPLSGRTVTWSSSNNGIASVTGSGVVTGVAAGAATITATSEGQSGSSALTVIAAPPPGTGVVFVGAGDISDCGNNNDEATAKLLDNIQGTVFTLGDNVYSSGTTLQFTQCYDPTWGRHKARTRPAPGNHDYNTSGATGYYGYFGSLAGPSGQGYYSYDLGEWHIISLNSNISMSAGSAQEQWLRADLAASTKTCTLAYWHHPRFSSGTHGSSTSPRPLWQALYDYNADLVLVGHDHNYQRFAPQTPAGVADPVRGIRQFVAGTGGASHYVFTTPIANTEAYNTDTFGVLKLTLNAGSYTWEFVPVAGKTYRDSGSGSCH
jgi:uncharacterized protein YjdB